MRYGFVIPGGDVDTLVEVAVQIEAAGWDAVFVAAGRGRGHLVDREHVGRARWHGGGARTGAARPAAGQVTRGSKRK